MPNDLATFPGPLLGPGPDGHDGWDHSIRRSLRAIRDHLGMTVAFVSEFAGGRRHFRCVDCDLVSQPVVEGGSDPLEDSYCQRVVDGRLPQLIHDARQNPQARELPVTEALPVGAHLSVPIRLSDGRIYGTYCCFSITPDHTLNDRDLAMMRAFADVAAHLIEQRLASQAMRTEKEERVRDVLANGRLTMLYQPIFRPSAGRLVGVEALARFPVEPTRPPDVWFNEAAEVDLAGPLERQAIQLALRALDALPAHVSVAVNVSPHTVLASDLLAVLDGVPLERVVLEVTEHAVIDSYEDLSHKIRPLRRRGVLLAVDDAGAGYASFRHILRLGADFIKLDASITRNVDCDRYKQALAMALIGFAKATECTLVAEGVETEAELATLLDLGVDRCQGYLLGRPMPLERAVALPSGT